jgi:SAM-dependent methyltransferase
MGAIMVTADTPESEWYAEAFGPLYSSIYAHRTVAAAGPEARFAAECLRLGPGDRVLDLACGKGRHMVHLLQHTPHVTGLDYSADLLTIARKRIVPGGRLVRADMRAIPFCCCFDAVTSFFTSFGYFDDDAENEAVLHALALLLRQGGRFFIDHANKAALEASLVPASTRDSGRYTITERRWIADNRVNKETVVSENGSTVDTFRESVRLYDPVEFQTLLERAGLAVDTMYGDCVGDSLTADSPRMVIVGHKP